MPETADAIIIGGGTTGCSIAWYLARAGLNVRLLERGSIASGSTGASPGIVRQYYPDIALATLAAECLDIYLDWRTTIGGDCGYRRTGFLTGIAPADWISAAELVATQRSAGIGVHLVSVAEMRELALDLVDEGLAGGIYEPDGGYCDPRATALCFAASARQMGAVLDEFQHVRRIHTIGGRVSGVETDDHRIESPIVINAAGPWAKALAATCGVDLPITATRQAVAMIGINEHEVRLPGYSDRAKGFYLRPNGKDAYLVGSLVASDSYVVNPDIFDQTVRDETIKRFTSRALQRFERFERATSVGYIVSFFDETPDGNPLIGAHPQVDGLFVAAGLSGHGFKFAPAFGQGISDLIQTGQTQAVFEKFAVARFDRG